MKKYFYCQTDKMGQRTGLVFSFVCPDTRRFVRRENGLIFSNIDIVDGNGLNTLLYNTEEEATRAALS